MQHAFILVILSNWCIFLTQNSNNNALYIEIDVANHSKQNNQLNHNYAG